MRKMTRAMTRKRAKPPQNGSVTSHHDQLMTWHNLSTTNAIPKRLNVLMPLVVATCLFDLFDIRLCVY